MASVIRIKQYSFSLSTPYKAGTVLLDTEAEALNALRAENIRNNVAKLVAEACGALAPDQILSAEQQQRLQAKITEYEQRYFFSGKKQRAPSAIESEARVVAAELAESQARGAGVDLSSDELEMMVVEMVSLPQVQEEARARVEERQRVVQFGLEDLL